MSTAFRTILIFVILLLLLGGALWWFVFRAEQAPPDVTSANTNTATVQANDIPSPDVIEVKGFADKDSDGLSDSEEQELGTNASLADSDADGLSDFDEVRVYGTNPLRADTDEDGFPDGEEVEQGFNPNGAGSLLNTEQAIRDFEQE